MMVQKTRVMAEEIEEDGLPDGWDVGKEDSSFWLEHLGRGWCHLLREEV